MVLLWLRGYIYETDHHATMGIVRETNGSGKNTTDIEKIYRYLNLHLNIQVYLFIFELSPNRPLDHCYRRDTYVVLSPKRHLFRKDTAVEGNQTKETEGDQYK